MDETNKRKNIYLTDKIARKVSCTRAILLYIFLNLKNQTTMDTFKRKKTPLSWEIYHPNQIDAINEAISEVEKVFEEYDIPEMPYYYKPNYHKTDSDSNHQSL